MILRDLPFSIYIYAMSLANVIYQAFGMLYIINRTSFINVCIKMTTSLRFFLSCDHLAYTETTAGHAYYMFITCCILGIDV